MGTINLLLAVFFFLAGVWELGIILRKAGKRKIEWDLFFVGWDFIFCGINLARYFIRG